MRTLRRSVWGLILAVLVSPPAHGTSCRTLSACESYSSASAVFLGQVIASETMPDGTTQNRFAIKEAFKGVAESQAVAVSRPEPALGLGAVALPVGETYLVFAGMDSEGRLVIGACGLPIPAHLAAGDLRFLHARGELNPHSVLYGVVFRLGSDMQPVSLPETTIETSSSSGSFQALSGSDGSFEFRNLPAGRYKVTAVLPDTLAPAEQETNLEAGGCASARLLTTWNGRISGRATRAQSQPLADTNVSLINLAEGRGESIVEATDEEGRYTFEHVHPGRYIVELFDIEGPSQERPFPPLFYPGVEDPALATVLEMGKGQKVDNADFKLEDLPQTLRIQVRWADRRAAADAQVFIEYEHSYCWKEACVLPYFVADRKGRAMFNGYGVGTVRVYATAKHRTGVEWISQI